MVTLHVDYVGHAYARAEELCGVAISDKVYLLGVAHFLLPKVQDEFLFNKVPVVKDQKTGDLDFPELYGVSSPSHLLWAPLMRFLCSSI